MSMQSIGQGAAAEQLFLAEYQSLAEKADPYALWLLFTVCFNAIQDGRLAQALLTAEVMHQQATQGGFVGFQGWARYLLGLAHYLWNDLDAAAKCFGEIAEEPYAHYGLTARWGLMGMVLTYQARGERAAAWQMLEQLSQFEVSEIGLELEETRALRALLCMTQGDRESACRWAETLVATAADRPLMAPLNTHLIRAQILCSSGTPADVAAALAIVDTISELAERTHNIRFRIACLALQALLFDAQGRADAAYAALRQAIDLAQPGGAIRSFGDLGPAMQELLQRLAQQGDAVDTIRHILAAFPAPHAHSETGATEFSMRAANAGLLEPLTSRELEVLALLPARLSNKEIAYRLGLSPTTVKRHTVNLYGKLGVNKRWDAVLKAEVLGLLPR
jgi:LuxR family maltose regulon positive regulatory protein